LLLMQLLPWKV